MANTKKSVGRPATKPVTKTETPKEEPIVTKEEKVKETPVKEPRKFDMTDVIECESVTAGELLMVGNKSGTLYRWSGVGDITEVEYRDLVASVRNGSDYVNKPYFIIRDEDFIKEFPKVEKVYETLYSIKELKDVLKLSEAQMIATIKTLPDSVQKSISHIASEMINSGQLDSVRKIKALDEMFGTQLMLLTGLAE